MNIYDRSDKRIFQVGQKVRFKEAWLMQRPDMEKRFSGRTGKVIGYRLGASEPIVEFPKDGPRKEQRLFEVQIDALLSVA